MLKVFSMKVTRKKADSVKMVSGTEAIQMAAELEGLLLDPVHTGKVMAGIIDHARSGVIRQGQTVLFIHTGGLPDLFYFAEELQRS